MGVNVLGGRRIRRADIRAARRTDRISIASPTDFLLARTDFISADKLPESQLLPYCVDLVRRRAIYVSGVQPRDAQKAPFYYLHLRRSARQMFSIPWECGPHHTGELRAPVFLFSPGRCGSTLLSLILYEAGVANVSEPDFFTQATSQFHASAFNPLQRQMGTTVLNMGHDLCVALSPSGPVVAKLRAESCRAPGLLLNVAEHRTLFMTRGFESWARSNGRAFRNGPRKTVGKYLTALACYDHLRQNTDCHFLRYEDLMANPSGTCQKLATFLQVEISYGAVSSAMQKDSQEGTPLAQTGRSDSPGWEQRLERTFALWNSDRVKRLRGRFGAVE